MSALTFQFILHTSLETDPGIIVCCGFIFAVTGSMDSSLMIWHFKPHVRAYRFVGHKVWIISEFIPKVKCSFNLCI